MWGLCLTCGMDGPVLFAGIVWIHSDFYTLEGDMTDLSGALFEDSLCARSERANSVSTSRFACDVENSKYNFTMTVRSGVVFIYSRVIGNE